MFLSCLLAIVSNHLDVFSVKVFKNIQHTTVDCFISVCDVCVTERNTSETRVPVYLPLFSIFIAVSALSAILWSAFYHRRNFPDVEEANFEFYHVSIQGLNYRQQDPVTIKVVARKAKLAWGFCRVRAYRKIRDVLWQPTPPCDESEMQEVTGQLLTGLRSYGSTGTTIVNS